MSVTLGINDHNLRNLLAQIIRPADETELKAQIKQMEDLALTHPHTVSLLEENIPGSRPFNYYQMQCLAQHFLGKRSCYELFDLMRSRNSWPRKASDH